MSYCLNCGKELPDDAKFCSACGKENVVAGNDCTAKREQEYVGKIKKCPACGEEIPALTAICPACGHELNSMEVTSSLASFIQTLDECDNRIAQEKKTAAPKKGFKAWDKKRKIGWIILNILTSFIPLAIYIMLPHIKPLFAHLVPTLTPEEKKKAELIENYAFPNEREALLEAILFIKAKMAFLESGKYSSKTMYWMNLWNTKTDQLQEKAKLVLNNDTIAEMAYTEVAQYKQKIQKKVRVRAAIAASAVILFSGFVIINGSVYRGVTRILNDVGIIENSIFFEWYDTGLSAKLPEVRATRGRYWVNTENELKLKVEGISDSGFEKYVTACTKAGFILDAEKKTNSYAAYNLDGDYLHIYLIGRGMWIELKTIITDGASFVWPDCEMADMIPIFETKQGKLISNTDTYFQISAYNVPEEEYEAYVEKCQIYGYNIDCVTADKSFRAFNDTGYEVVISLDEVKTMSITLQAPMETSEIEWRAQPLAKKIPEPTSTIGHISSNSEKYFSVYIVNITEEEYNDYIDKCIKKGYDIDYYRSDNYFNAENRKGYSISVDYMRNNIMHISVNAPRDQ